MNKIGITIGDVNGIGIEVLIKSFKELKSILKQNRLIVFGEKVHLEFYFKEQEMKNNLQFTDMFTEFSPTLNKPSGRFEIFPLKFRKSYLPEPGRISKISGELAHRSIITACSEVKNKNLDSIVTLPISKESIRAGGCRQTGHTTILEDYFKKKITMVFLSEEMNVILITIHLPISKVPSKISKEEIIQKIETVYHFFKKRKRNQKFLILGLNPHAGENSLLGKEEESIIIPAVKTLITKGIKISGPVSPDAAFSKKNRDNFDFFVAMYHDQGLIPFKMLALFKSCQVSTGLDFIRTSVSHGTGFDIAGKGIAYPDSFIYAVKKNIELLQ